MTLSIQETYYPDLTCFGCGHANEKGLRLRSYADGGLVTGEFLPWPEHDNGGGYLNGGIIATLLDCHSGAVMFHTAFDRGWPPTPEAPLPFVTAGLDVRFRRPAPLTEPVSLVGEVLAADEGEMRIAVRLEWDGKVRAEGDALWKRWRPR